MQAASELTRIGGALQDGGLCGRGWVSDQLKPAFRSLASPESSSYTTIVGSILRTLNGSVSIAFRQCQASSQLR